VIILNKVKKDVSVEQSEIGSTDQTRARSEQNSIRSISQGRDSNYVESIDDSEICYFERKSHFEVMFYN